jgi:hypothetical protein
MHALCLQFISRTGKNVIDVKSSGESRQREQKNREKLI